MWCHQATHQMEQNMNNELHEYIIPEYVPKNGTTAYYAVLLI